MGTKKITEVLFKLSLLVWPFGLLLVFHIEPFAFPIYYLDVLVVSI
jgi:hypothetical protein